MLYECVLRVSPDRSLKSTAHEEAHKNRSDQLYLQKTDARLLGVPQITVYVVHKVKYIRENLDPTL